MIRERQVVLFQFPRTNQTDGELRPARVIQKVFCLQEDWLIGK